MAEVVEENGRLGEAADVVEEAVEVLLLVDFELDAGPEQQLLANRGRKEKLLGDVFLLLLLML